MVVEVVAIVAVPVPVVVVICLKVVVVEQQSGSPLSKAIAKNPTDLCAVFTKIFLGHSYVGSQS